MAPNPPYFRTAPAKPWRSSVLRSALAQQPAVVGHHAAILDDANARAGQLGGGVVVADAELEPHHGRLPRQAQDLARVPRQELRTPEDLDGVHPLRQVG